jgi:hypothetical protein
VCVCVCVRERERLDEHSNRKKLPVPFSAWFDISITARYQTGGLEPKLELEPELEPELELELESNRHGSRSGAGSLKPGQ